MASLIDITTLGEFTIRAAGSSLPAPVAQRRRMAVLLYLAAAGPSGVARERLLATFWPERNDDSARNLLNQTLSAIRQLSHDLVRVGPAGEVRLDSALVSLDALIFDAQCARKAWPDAISLYRGPFLDGFALGGAAEFEHWIERERARHARSYGAALEGMARAATERADLVEAEKWWRQRVTLEPTSGRAVRALMQTLADAGERAHAIEEARKYERVLRNELSVAMDEATAELVRQLHEGGGRRPLPERGSVERPDGSLGTKREEASEHHVVNEPGTLVSAGQSTHTARAAPSRSNADISAIVSGAATPRWGLATLSLVLLSLVGASTGLYALRNRANASEETRTTDSLLTLPRTGHKVAVLPFANLSGDSAGAIESEGLTDDLITRLSAASELRVVPMASARRYRDATADPETLRRESGVTAMVEGGVRRDLKGVHISVRLVDTRTNTVRWSQTFDRGPDQTFAIQAEVARAVAQALGAQLTPAVLNRMQSDARSSPTAMEYFIRGKAYFMRAEHADSTAEMLAMTDSAESFFRRMLSVDPQSARAHAWLALVCIARFNGDLGKQWVDSSSHHAKMAVAIDSTDGMNVAALGGALFFSRHVEEARATLRRAVALSPNDAFVLSLQSWTGSGHLEDDIARMERMIALASDDLTSYANLAFTYMIIDDTSAMRAIDERMLALFPNNQWVLWGYRARRALVDIYLGDSAGARAEVRAYLKTHAPLDETTALTGTIELALGNLEGARRELEASLAHSMRDHPGDSAYVETYQQMYGWFRGTSLAYLALKSGDRARALRILAERERADNHEITENGNPHPDAELYDLGVIAALRGNSHRAFEYIERAVDVGFLLHRWLLFDPRIESLRGDARFELLVKRAKVRADSIRAVVQRSQGRMVM